jgi:serine/threonine protein kinase
VASTNSFPSGSTLGRYEVRSLLGAGGMGEVYLGRDPVLRRSVALKVLREGVTDEDKLRRFETEACAASALNHPHILTIYEFGVEGTTRFIACEHIEGETLRQRLQRGPLDLPAALDVALQVASALATAHDSGIVHRDIKPENIMIRPDGYAKVLDFGLAKLTEARVPDDATMLSTVPGMLLGTAHYMSPEQARGLPVDARSDVWSFGCVLYEMVSGRAPFSGATLTDVLAAVLHREPEPIERGDVTIPSELAVVLDKALTKDSESRYQSMKDVLVDLRRIRRRMEGGSPSGLVAGAPVVTPESPSRESARESAQRWRAVWAIPMVFGLGIGLWFATGPLRRQGALTEASRPSQAAVAPATTQAIDVWLSVQKMRDGKPYMPPFETSGAEIFETGYKFWLNVVSRDRARHVYVVSQEPGSGSDTYRLLFPTPSQNAGSSRLEAGQAIRAGAFVFTAQQGIEKLWIVAAASPVDALERVKPVVNPTDQGVISKVRDRSAIASVLSDQAALGTRALVAADTSRISLASDAPVLVHLLRLKHH